MSATSIALVALLCTASAVFFLRASRRARVDTQALLDGLDDAALIVDRRGSIVAFNNAFEHLCGVTAELLSAGVVPLEKMLWAWAAQAYLDEAGVATLIRELCQSHPERSRFFFAGRAIDVKQIALADGRFAQLFVDSSDRDRLDVALRRSDEEKKLLLEIAPVGMTIASLSSGELLFANRRVAASLGFDDPRELVGHTTLRFYVNPEQRREMVETLKRDGAIDHCEVEMRSVKGETFWVMFSSRVIDYGGERVIFSVTSNITGIKLAEEATRRSEQKLHDLLEIAPSAIFIFDVDDARVLFHNRMARALVGVESGSILGQRVPEFFADAADRAQLIDAIQHAGVVREREMRIRTGPGEMHWFHISATLVEYEGRAAMFCALLDIDARRQAETQLRLARVDAESANRELRVANMELEQLASTDRLTRAFNRRHFEEVTLREMSRARRYSLPLALIMIDLDYFKAINDDFGHAAGDRVLLELTQLLRTHLRSSDMLARWGGEEFVILATSTAVDEAVLLADKLRDLFQHHEFTDLRPLTFSAGVTSLSFRDTLDTFIRRVDKALYRAKSGGRNRVESLGSEVLV